MRGIRSPQCVGTIPSHHRKDTTEARGVMLRVPVARGGCRVRVFVGLQLCRARHASALEARAGKETGPIPNMGCRRQSPLAIVCSVSQKAKTGDPPSQVRRSRLNVAANVSQGGLAPAIGGPSRFRRGLTSQTLSAGSSRRPGPPLRGARRRLRWSVVGGNCGV